MKQLIVAGLFIPILLAFSAHARQQQPTILATASKSSVSFSSQAGCKCSKTWTYKYNATSKVEVAGCANPDLDPKGEWCPIDPKSCPGYYGNFTRLGETTFFDYCGKVRGITSNGCICKPITWDSDWFMQQKPVYDSCTGQNSGGDLWCYVDPKTCKKTPYSIAQNVSKEDTPQVYDFCEIAGRPPRVLFPPDKTPTTQGGCECAPDWQYYENINDQSEVYTGCQDTDFDPKGSWCIVNPLVCKGAYGVISQGRKPIYYDYCGNVTDFTTSGCRCKRIWGDGKLMDRCANPDNKARKWCEIMPDTCTKGAPAGDGWDFCGPAPPSPSPKLINKSSTPTTRTTPTAPRTEIVVVAPNTSQAQAAPSKEDKTRQYVVIMVPILTGTAALVTIAYTLFKCHKKRKFFKSTQLHSIHQTLTAGIGGGKQGTAGAAAAAAKAATTPRGEDIIITPPSNNTV